MSLAKYKTARVLTYLIMLVTFMTYKTLPQEDRQFEENPYRWIAYRKVLLILLAAFVITVCAAETVILLRHYSKQIRGRIQSQPITNDIEAN
ncbi:hypothetical protein WR25_21656 [Diploscapter pachys]|uniref:Uncharacterized protein n=1 Tax=Diploscapter pachys TaxID=2018661 RepID=A0A2A2LC25_9BILA|nr:hypothetical protein WR25_21656 [Diploscapter pachys]